MVSQQNLHNLIRYFQLIIFVLYLTHGFIPHHHHNHELVSSYDINFSHDSNNCSCNTKSLHHGDNLHSDCQICDQLAKEFQNQSLFFKEPIFNLSLFLPEDVESFLPSETNSEYADIPIFIFSDKAIVLTNGLRAPPVA